MRAVLQRVSDASVEVDGQTIGQINSGLMILICAMEGDHPDMLPKFAAKIAKLRIFSDETGRMNKSVLDQGGAVLLVSQFTLAGDTSRGNRPGFSSAAPPDLGKTLYEGLGDELAKLGITVARGQFGADMKVRLVNDGPVTIWMDSTA